MTLDLLVGDAAVALGLLSSIAGATVVAAGIGLRRPALLRSVGRYVLLLMIGAVAAVVAMERALLSDNFAVAYVADNSARSTPTPFKIATMWAALEGSILLWALVLAGYTFLVHRHFSDRGDDKLVSIALGVMFVVAAFFFALMLGPADPFQSVGPNVPADGPGPNPLLQNHLLMAFHPPLLYLGYVGFTVPFAFAIASLASGRMGEGWLVETRRWTLFAWGFLTTGILLGAWWSYEVLGWGGFWGWDPVENASLLPWLTGTAFIHSVMIQERRGMLRVWNLSLVVATFALTILGTFLTRSGVLDSVHAFSDSGIGPLLLGFFGVVVLVSLALIGWRGDQLRSPGSIDSPMSREGAFLLNNLLFAAFAFVVLLGTVFPLVVEAIRGDRISVGRPYFERMVLPISLTLLFLMAIAPALPWRRASGEMLRTRLHWPAWAGTGATVLAVAVGLRGLAPLLAVLLGGFAAGAAARQLALAMRRQGWRGVLGRTNGGMIVHLGVVIVSVAIAVNQSTSVRQEVRLQPGDSVYVDGHRLDYLGQLRQRHPNRSSVVARIRVDAGRVYEPAISNYPFASQGIGTPSVRTGAFEDVYLTLITAPKDPDATVTVGVVIQPLAVWLWIGGGVMAGGTVLSAVPTRISRRPTDPGSLPTRTLETMGSLS